MATDIAEIGDAAVDAAIDRLSDQAPDKKEKSSKVKELLAEAQKEEAEATGPDGEVKKPKDIWTFDAMRKRQPLPGDLYGDGEFLFTFKPVLGTPYCQKRFSIAEAYKGDDPQGFAAMEIAYAEIVYFAMKGCKWPVRETLDDPTTGEPLYEDDGVTPKSVPLPITLDNIMRMDNNMLVDFLNAMSRAISGEVSTQP